MTRTREVRSNSARVTKRFGVINRLRPEALQLYKEFHQSVWPDVLALITRCNIRNYSIYQKDGYLFAYFEYHGTDYKRDMDKMARCPTMRRWWSIMEPMQDPLETRAEGEWWAEMEEVFHLD